MGQEDRNFRRYKEGASIYDWELSEKIFEQDHTYKCPVYIHRTPPCQGSCPAGEDIRGWLNIIRGIEKPTQDLQEKDLGWAEICVPALDRRQSVSGDHGQGLSRAL